jgi:COMPASS component SPP1
MNTFQAEHQNPRNQKKRRLKLNAITRSERLFPSSFLYMACIIHSSLHSAQPKPKDPATANRPKRPYKRTAAANSANVDDFLPVSQEARQCYGPRCVEPAREGSKYCSNECGLKLATKLVQLCIDLFVS